MDRLDERIDRVQSSIESMQRTMLQVGGGMMVTILATLISVIATRA